MSEDDRKLMARAIAAAARYLTGNNHYGGFQIVVEWLLDNLRVIRVECGEEAGLYRELMLLRKPGVSKEKHFYDVLKRHGYTVDDYDSKRKLLDRYGRDIFPLDEDDGFPSLIGRILAHLSPLPAPRSPGYAWYQCEFSQDEIDNWWHV